MSLKWGANWRATFDLNDKGPGWDKFTSSDSGDLGFGAGRGLEAYSRMFEATGDRRYLVSACEVIKHAFAVAATAQKTVAPYPAGTWCWSSDKYTTDHARVPWALHDGMLLAGVMKIILAIDTLPADDALHMNAQLWLGWIGEKFVHRWDASFKALGNSKRNRPRACLLMPTWVTHYSGIRPGASLPTNNASGWARFLYLYGKRANDQAAIGKALLLAETLHDDMSYAADGGARWHYARLLVGADAGKYCGGPWSDSSHATIDIGLIVDMRAGGDVFDGTDMQKIALNFVNHIAAPKHDGYAIHHWMDGTGMFDDTNLSQWPSLAPFHPLVTARCTAIVKNTDPDLVLGGPTGILALANLARFDPEH